MYLRRMGVLRSLSRKLKHNFKLKHKFQIVLVHEISKKITFEHILHNKYCNVSL